MKKLLLLTILLSMRIVAFSQANEKLMPVTTNSKTALNYYHEGMKLFYKVKLEKALESFRKSLDEDPDFFMANYQLAFFFLLNQSGDNFQKYADAALNCQSKLSEAEELLKEALGKLKQGETDVTGVGEKLMQMYPRDPDSYNNMVYFQSLAADSSGMLETLNKAIKIAPEPGPFYNQLGYSYLTMNQPEKAEQAFNKYIELEPQNANAYDSKGDYYMYIKQYDKAYESYMTAHSMDSSFSLEKATIAKRLYEQTEGKKLEIITI